MRDGDGDGEADRDGDGDGDADGDGMGELDDVAIGSAVGDLLPVHATPFTAKLVGEGLLPVHDPLKPNDTEPLVAIEPLWLMFFAVTAEPLCVSAASDARVTVCSASNDHVNVQLVNGSPRFVIDTFASNPSCHCDDTP